MRELQVIDSHTGGEPTRVVVSGVPDLGPGSVTERLTVLQREHDWIRRAVILEPRGSEVMVGAVLLAPQDPANACGVIFFNNVGYLNMCGHGTIGLMETLRHLGRLTPGEVKIETCVGVVSAWLDADGAVTLRNVPSYRKLHHWPLEIPGHGGVHGDVAWGGNWFLLIADHGLEITLKNVSKLTEFSLAALAASHAAGETEIDHVELFGPGEAVGADSQNFVLCPGQAYDRSPCGTGTSAKLACLYADGKLAPGQVWRQAGILGTSFLGRVEVEDGQIIPYITGRAFVNAEVKLLLHPEDPFAEGIG